MANQWLTGAGVPSTGIGQVTDYYRDTVNNLVYYRENAFTWTVVPAFTPNPDGVGTTWLHGNVPPLTGQGSDGDYYYDEVQLIVYRKDGATWVPKGSLDFIGIYGVQWGNGSGAPSSTAPLNALPAGSFYLDVDTSDIYFKPPSMVWELKGQLGGGGSGSSITVENVLTSTNTLNALSAAQGKVLNDALVLKAPLASPALTGVPTAPLAAPDTNTTQVATTSFVRQEINAVTPSSIGAEVEGAAATAESSAKSYADGLVVGLWDDRGAFSAVTGVWPTDSSNGSGVAGAILKGDIWSISAAGTLTGGIVVNIGDVIRALVDGAGNTATDWGVTENNIGYVAENSTNKATSLVSPDNTKYPTTQAVVIALGGYEPTLPANVDSVKFLREDRTFQSILDTVLTGLSTATNAVVTASDTVLTALGKLQKQITDLAASALTPATLRYTVTTPTIVANVYTVVSGDVNAAGSVIVTCTSASSITVTFPTPATLGATTGDSVNIRQGGAGVVTLSGALTGNLVFSAIHDTRTIIATSSTTWMVVGG